MTRIAWRCARCRTRRWQPSAVTSTHKCHFGSQQISSSKKVIKGARTKYDLWTVLFECATNCKGADGKVFLYKKLIRKCGIPFEDTSCWFYIGVSGCTGAL